MVNPRLLVGCLSAVLLSASAQAQDEASPVGSAADRFVTQNTGQVSQQIAIPVPVGTGGFQPQLSLTYSSGSRASGPFGVGWSLSLSQIRRATRYGIPAYDASDQYELDQELLIEDPANVGEYRTVSESFARISYVSADESWVVEFPNGNIARFGTTPDSQIRLDGSTTPSGDTGPISAWLASELEDAHGNVVHIDYERSIDVGTAYPKSVIYTYRGGSLVGGLERRVEFLLEDRDDDGLVFVAGVEANLTKRVHEIRSTIGGAPFRRLMLSYSDPSDYSVHRTRLSGAQIFGDTCSLGESDPQNNCQGLPKKTYEYTDPAVNLGSGVSTNWIEDQGFWATEIAGSTGSQNGVVFGDIDGDGRADMLRSATSSGGSSNHEVYLASETGSFDSAVRSAHWEQQLAAVDLTHYRVDVSTCDSTVAVLDNDGAHFVVGPQSAPTVVPNSAVRLIDLNDDGRSDLVVSWEFGAAFFDKDVCGGPADETRTASHSMKGVWLNAGTTWERDANLSDSLPVFFSTFHEAIERSDLPELWVARSPNHLIVETGSVIAHLYEDDHGARFVELNGDGRPDLVVAREDARNRVFQKTAYLNTASGWVEAPEFTPPVSFIAEHIFGRSSGGIDHTASSDTGVRFADLNGDGLTDILKTALEELPNPQYTQPSVFGTAGVWLNTGRGWCSSGGTCAAASRYQLPAGASFVSEETLLVYLEEIFVSSGGRDEVWGTGIHSSPYLFQDLNGDGLPDLLRMDGREAGQLRAWIHDPSDATSVWKEDVRFQPHPSMQLVWSWGGRPVGAGARVVDTDHDGMLDVAYAQSSSRAAFRSATTHSDLLSLYTNGAGGQIAWTYTSPVAQRDAGLESDATFDASDLGEFLFQGPWLQTSEIVRWSHQPVVVSSTTSGVDTPTATFSYLYAYPAWCRDRRSSLGFRIFESTNDQDDSVAHLRFWQDHGRAGRQSRREIRDGVEILRRELDTWDVLDGSLVTGSVPGANVGRLTQSVRHNAVPYHPLPARDTTIGYDDAYGYNFVDQITAIRATGTLITNRTPRAADTTNWVVGLVDEETQTGPGGIVYARSTRDYLVGTAKVTQTDRDIQLREAGATLEAVATTLLSYDVFGNLRSVTDPEQRVREFCYDGDSTFEGGESCPAAPSVPIALSGSAQSTHSVPTAVKDRFGDVNSVDFYLGTGEVAAIERYNGDSTWRTRDGFGRTVEIWTQPASHASGTLLETRNYFDGIANAAGQPYSERWLEIGDDTAIREAAYFDGFGGRGRSVFSTPSGWAGRIAVRDYRGLPVSTTPDVDCGADEHCAIAPPPGVDTAATYDALGRPLTVTAPDSGLTLYQYFAGWDWLLVGSFESRLTIAPDSTVSVETFDGSRLVQTLDCDSPLSCPSTLPGPQSALVDFEYDPVGFITKKTGVNQPCTDDDDCLTYKYDTLGRVREIGDPDGGTTLQTYDRVGNLETFTNARGQTTNYSYDALDRIISIDRPGSEPDVLAYYSGVSRKKSLTISGSVVTTHEYDDFGRESRRSVTAQGVKLMTDFEYDLLGRITKVTYPDHTVMHYAYEGAYLKSVCGADGSCSAETTWVSDITYDAVGREDQLFDRHGTRDVDYDATTYQLKKKSYQDASSGEFWLDLAFAYDVAGRIEQIADAHNGPGSDGISATADFTYDSLGARLRSWTWSPSPGSSETRWFDYNNEGNLAGRDLPTETSPHNLLYEDATRPHAVTTRSDTGKTYAYDDDGNVTRRGNQHITFNAANQVTCVGTSAGSCDLATYGYDAEGVLAYEVAGGETRIFANSFFVWESSTNTAFAHIYANGRQIGEQQRDNGTLRTGWLPPNRAPPVDPWNLLWAATFFSSLALLLLAARSGTFGAIRARPIRASVVLATVAAILAPAPALAGGGSGTLTRRMVHHDHLGNRVLLVSDSPDVIYRRVFEPFGEVVAESTGTEDHTRFLTAKRESVATRDGAGTGIVNFGARWYDPEIGRFLSVDPIVEELADPQSHNPYSYVRDNPANFTDPDGRGIGKLLKQILGGLLIVAGLYLVDYSTIAYGVGLILTTTNDRTLVAVGNLLLTIGSLGTTGDLDILSGVGGGGVTGSGAPVIINHNEEDDGLDTGTDDLAGLAQVGKDLKEVVESVEGGSATEQHPFSPEPSNVGSLPTYIEHLGFWRGLENWANAKAIEDEESRNFITDREPNPDSNYRALEFVAAQPAGTAAALLTGGVPGLVRLYHSAVIREVGLNATKGFRDAGGVYAPAAYSRGGQIAYGISYVAGTALRVSGQILP